MTTQPKPFVFFGSLFFDFFFSLSVFVCVFPVSLWTFHQTSTGLPLNTPKKKKKLSKDKDACVYERGVCEVPTKKLFIWTHTSIFFCHHKFFLVSFLSMTVRVSEARSDWRLWDNREREGARERWTWVWGVYWQHTSKYKPYHAQPTTRQPSQKTD